MNKVADALSRIEMAPEHDIWEELPADEFLKRYSNDQKFVRMFTTSKAKQYEQPSLHENEPPTLNPNQPYIICVPGLATIWGGYDYIFHVITAENDDLILNPAEPGVAIWHKNGGATFLALKSKPFYIFNTLTFVRCWKVAIFKQMTAQVI